MTAGLALLALAYVLSQFFRAFLAVLAPDLQAAIGADPADLAFASGLWFLSFAAFQLPVGWALDTLGPRRTAASLLLVGGGGGATLFAFATGPAHLNIAMVLIGMGCAPVLMASYYIFARQFDQARFATLASVMVGVGTLGNLVASYPMVMAAQTIGWRAALGGLAGLSVLTAAGIWVLVKDPEKPADEGRGSLMSLLKLPALWLILPLTFVSYAQVGALRGLWIGPYLADVFGAQPQLIGQATLLMGLSMIAGTLCYGPLDRVFGTRKWVIAGGTGITLGALLLLRVLPDGSLAMATGLMCAVGFFGATYAPIISHGRSFLPPHLIGRGITLLNLFSIGGVGVLQFVSGRAYAASLPGATLAAPYTVVFTLMASMLGAGLLIYLFSRDSRG